MKLGGGVMRLDGRAKTLSNEGNIMINDRKLKFISNGRSIDNYKIRPLLLMLKDDQIFEHVKRFFNREFYITTISGTKVIVNSIGFFSNDSQEIHETKKYTAEDILDCLSKLKLIGKSKKRYEELVNISNLSYQKFVEEYKDKEHKVKIHGKEISVPILKMIKFIELNENQYKEFFNIKDKNIYNERRIFIYCLVDFFRKNRIFAKYIFPKKAIMRVEDDLSLSESIDIQVFKGAFNREQQQKKFDNIEVNEDFIKDIISDMPKDLNKLEQSMYVYIKMCKLLTYDDEYYSSNQEGVVEHKHSDISHLKEINIVNNEVVCFEFNAIYARILNDLGLDYDLYEKSNQYGKGHAYLTLTDGRFIIIADSTDSILYGDLFRAKMNMKLYGFRCENLNKESAKEFNDSLDKVYKLINKNQQSLGINYLGTLLSQYKSLITTQELPFDKRLELFFEIIEDTSLYKVDNLGYIMSMRKEIFTKYQLEENINITIVANNKPLDVEKSTSSLVIFAVNNEGFKMNSNTKYYSYDGEDQITEVSRQSIESKIVTGEYSLIGSSNDKIPGIEVKLKRKGDI